MEKYMFMIKWGIIAIFVVLCIALAYFVYKFFRILKENQGKAVEEIQHSLKKQMDGMVLVMVLLVIVFAICIFMKFKYGGI